MPNLLRLENHRHATIGPYMHQNHAAHAAGLCPESRWGTSDHNIVGWDTSSPFHSLSTPLASRLDSPMHHRNKRVGL